MQERLFSTGSSKEAVSSSFSRYSFQKALRALHFGSPNNSYFSFQLLDGDVSPRNQLTRMSLSPNIVAKLYHTRRASDVLASLTDMELVICSVSFVYSMSIMHVPRFEQRATR